MKILVTNDDGIYSPGLAALAKVAARFGEVIIVAPNVEQSSSSHSITSSRPLNYKKSPILFDGMEAYKVNGTPADCVALGIFLAKDVDLVLSGINMGPNLGNAIWHSGTLAAGNKQHFWVSEELHLARRLNNMSLILSSLTPLSPTL